MKKLTCLAIIFVLSLPGCGKPASSQISSGSEIITTISSQAVQAAVNDPAEREETPPAIKDLYPFIFKSYQEYVYWKGFFPSSMKPLTVGFLYYRNMQSGKIVQISSEKVDAFDFGKDNFVCAIGNRLVYMDIKGITTDIYTHNAPVTQLRYTENYLVFVSNFSVYKYDFSTHQPVELIKCPNMKYFNWLSENDFEWNEDNPEYIKKMAVSGAVDNGSLSPVIWHYYNIKDDKAYTLGTDLYSPDGLHSSAEGFWFDKYRDPADLERDKQRSNDTSGESTAQ